MDSQNFPVLRCPLPEIDTAISFHRCSPGMEFSAFNLTGFYIYSKFLIDSIASVFFICAFKIGVFRSIFALMDY